MTTYYLKTKKLVMENELVRPILAGVIATAVMTGVTFMAPNDGIS